MCTRTNYIANTGVVNISSANPNLDGTGALGLVLTGAANGTQINAVVIKATASTTGGMIRLFISRGAVGTLLEKEIFVPAIIQSPTTKSFEVIVDDFFWLDSGDELYASTENAESFNICAYGVNTVNCECSENADVCCADVQIEANTGVVKIDTANGNLDGTGAMGTIITAPGSADGGTRIDIVVVKATAVTTQGMLRFFLNDSINNYLIREIEVPAMTPSAVHLAYRASTYFGLPLQATYSLKISTENAETFNALADALNLTNCPC